MPKKAVKKALGRGMQCFINLHHTKAPSGNPLILQENREDKMVWLQIQAKLECSTEEEDDEDSTDKEEEDL
eukprot:4233144-Ditylum_brightwellii.AAC.1